MQENIAWLKDFYRRFDGEVKLLYRNEPFWNTCNKCSDGYCCAHAIFPVLQSAGNPFSAEEWWIQLEYARDHFTPEEKKQLLRNVRSKRKDCIFLFGSRCAIHPARSWACRVHPYVISYHPAPTIFPVGEMALPSCPTLASAFDIGIDEQVTQKPTPIERHPDGRLVKVKLRKRKPLWLIDASDYVKEYQQHAPIRHDRPIGDWEEVVKMAKEAGGGGDDSEIMAHYLAFTQGMTYLPDGRIGYEA